MREKFTKKMNVAFTKKTGDLIEELAKTSDYNPADIIRECVEKEIPKLKRRILRRRYTTTT